jgi:hypothetical protein
VLATMLKAVCNHYSEVLESLDRAAQDVEAAFRARQQGGHDEILRMIEAHDRRCPAGASARPSGGVSVHHRAVVDGA